METEYAAAVQASSNSTETDEEAAKLRKSLSAAQKKLAAVEEQVRNTLLSAGPHGVLQGQERATWTDAVLVRSYMVV